MNTYTLINEKPLEWIALKELGNLTPLINNIYRRFEIKSGVLDILKDNRVSGLELAAALYDKNLLYEYLSQFSGINLKTNIVGLLWEIRPELLEEALLLKKIVKNSSLCYHNETEDPF